MLVDIISNSTNLIHFLCGKYCLGHIIYIFTTMLAGMEGTNDVQQEYLNIYTALKKKMVVNITTLKVATFKDLHARCFLIIL